VKTSPNLNIIQGKTGEQNSHAAAEEKKNNKERGGGGWGAEGGSGRGGGGWGGGGGGGGDVGWGGGGGVCGIPLLLGDKTKNPFELRHLITADIGQQRTYFFPRSLSQRSGHDVGHIRQYCLYSIMRKEIDMAST